MKTSWSAQQSLIDRGLGSLIRAVILNLGRIFYRVKVIGGENLPERSGVVFVCNHVSYADTIPLSMAVKRHFRFTSFEGLFEQPVLGRCLRAFGSIPGERNKCQGNDSSRGGLCGVRGKRAAVSRR